VATNIAIIQTNDFIRAKPDGALDLEASRTLLVEVVSAIRRIGEHNVLIDTRAAAPTRLSRADLWKLGVAASTQPALAQGRVALLVPLDKRTTRSSSRVSLAWKAQTSRRFPTSKARFHG
jgi:hypothetical protein